MNYKKIIAEKVKAIKTGEVLAAERAARIDAMLAAAWAPIIEVFDAIKDMDVKNFRCHCHDTIKVEEAFTYESTGGLYHSRKLEAYSAFGNVAWSMLPGYNSSLDEVTLRLEQDGKRRTLSTIEAIEFITDHVAKLAAGEGV